MAIRWVHWKRVALKPIHTWIGIIAGGLLAVIGVTGSVIVFRADFERAALPKSGPATGHIVSLDESARQVTKLWPDARIRRVRLPAAAGEPYVFQIESEEKRTVQVVSDAASGRVLGTVENGWVEWVIDLHRNLLSGKQGRKAVGFAGILLFALSTTGLLMWLVGQRNWRSWISVRQRGPARRFNFELHRASGLWAYSFLSVISFTGIGLAFPETFRQAMQSMTGRPAVARVSKRMAKGSRSKATRSLDEYVRNASAAMPDGRPVELRLQGGQSPVELRLYRAGDLELAGNHVYLDPATAAVVRVDRIASRPLGERLLAAFSPVHYGDFGGLPVKIVWSLLGLTPLLLFVTGLIAWWRPSRRQPIQPAAQPAETLVLARSER